MKPAVAAVAPPPAPPAPAPNQNLDALEGMATTYQNRFEQDQAALDNLQPPQMGPAPTPPQDPRVNQNGIMRSMPFLIGLATIGGKLANVSGKAMLGSVNAMMQGAIQGNEQAYKEARRQYDEAWTRYKSKYDVQAQVYEQMREVFKGRVDADLKALEIARRAIGDQTKIDHDSLRAWQWEMDYARKMHDAEERSRLMEQRIATLQSQSGLNNARADHLRTKFANPAETVDQAGQQIDALIQHLDANPRVAGLWGYGTRFLESVKGTLGNDDPAPAHEFSTAMNAFMLQLPKLLTGSSKSAKDERARIDSIASAISAGVPANVAKQKLLEIKSILANHKASAPKTLADNIPAPAGAPGAKPKYVVGKIYTDANGNRAEYQADGSWRLLPKQ